MLDLLSPITFGWAASNHHKTKDSSMLNEHLNLISIFSVFSFFFWFCWNALFRIAKDRIDSNSKSFTSCSNLKAGQSIRSFLFLYLSIRKSNFFTSTTNNNSCSISMQSFRLVSGIWVRALLLLFFSVCSLNFLLTFLNYWWKKFVSPRVTAC